MTARLARSLVALWLVSALLTSIPSGRPDARPAALAEAVRLRSPGPCTHPGVTLSSTSLFPRTIHLGRPLQDLVVSQATGHVFALSRPTSQDLLAACPETIFMLDGRSGALLATAAAPGQLRAPAVDERARRLFVASWFSGGKDGVVSLVDTRTGQLVATTPVGGIPGPIVPLPGTGRVVVATYFPPCPCSLVLRVLDAATGRLLRASTAQLGESIVGGDGNKRLYALSGSRLIALDAMSGRELWQRNLPGCADAYSMAFAPFSGRLFLSRGGYEDVRTGRTEHGSFCVVDAATGALVRMEDEGAAGLFVLAVDTRARAVIGEDRPAAPVGGPAASTPDGEVVLLDPRDGRVRRNLGFTAATAVVDDRTGRLYLLDGPVGGSGPWTIWMLDPRRWRRAALALGQRGTALGLDEGAHRLFLGDGLSDAITMLCADKRC